MFDYLNKDELIFLIIISFTFTAMTGLYLGYMISDTDTFKKLGEIYGKIRKKFKR